MRSAALLFGALLGLLLILSPSAAYEPGDRVAIAETDPVLPDDDSPLLGAPLGTTLIVRGSSDKWLLVQYDRQAWILESDVLPLDEAATRFSARLQEHGHDPAVYAARARVYVAENNFDKALEGFNTAIRLQPAAEYYCERANVYQWQGLGGKAVWELTRAIAADGECAPAYFSRGAKYVLLGQPELALYDYNRAIALDDMNLGAYIGRSNVQGDLGHFAEAIGDAETALALDPSHPVLYNNLAWLLATVPDEELRDGERALQYADYACQVSGYDSAPLLDTLAAAYAEAGDFESAKLYEQRVIDLLDKRIDPAPYEERLALYEQEQPYHQARPGEAATEANAVDK